MAGECPHCGKSIRITITSGLSEQQIQSLYGSTGIDSIDGISMRAYNCLTAAGIVETSQVNSMTDKELLRLKNMGRRSVQNIREAIALASAGAK